MTLSNSDISYKMASMKRELNSVVTGLGCPQVPLASVVGWVEEVTVLDLAGARQANGAAFHL